MAIIYSYPEKSSPVGTDVLIITDSEETGKNKNRTRSLTVDSLYNFVVTSLGSIVTNVSVNTSAFTSFTATVSNPTTTPNITFTPLGTSSQVFLGDGSLGTFETGTVTGTGTADTISVFKTSSEIYTPVNTTIIAGKSFIQKIDQTAATIELGASTSFAGVNEGLKIYPNTTHFTTRVTPWLEVFAYEDPSLNPLNTYNAAYEGSALIVGKSNTVGDANSSNLAIIGFNNTLKGDKMMVVGQTNVIDGVSNSSSLVVGVSNTSQAAISLKNSLIVGQSNSLTGNVNQSIINGGGHSISLANSSFVNGSSNQLKENTKNIIISGRANIVKNSENSTIACGSSNTIGNKTTIVNTNNNNFIAGESNALGGVSNFTQVTKNSFAIGRGNLVNGQLSGAIGGGNFVYGTTAGNSFAIGNANTIGDMVVPVRNAIAIGTANNVDSDYTIHIGRGLDEVATGGGEYVMVGRNNDQNNDYDLSSMSVSFVVGASNQGAANSRRNAIVVQNKTAGPNESNVILPGVGKYRNYATEAAAKAGGVPLYGLYHTDGVVHIVYTP